MKQYALYKGEKLLAMGTIYQIAEQLGLKYHSVYFYTTPCYKKRIKNSKNRRELIEI